MAFSGENRCWANFFCINIVHCVHMKAKRPILAQKKLLKRLFNLAIAGTGTYIAQWTASYILICIYAYKQWKIICSIITFEFNVRFMCIWNWIAFKFLDRIRISYPTIFSSPQFCCDCCLAPGDWIITVFSVNILTTNSVMSCFQTLTKYRENVAAFVHSFIFVIICIL